MLMTANVLPQFSPGIRFLPTLLNSKQLWPEQRHLIATSNGQPGRGPLDVASEPTSPFRLGLISDLTFDASDSGKTRSFEFA
jgi:hypothetical protein